MVKLKGLRLTFLVIMVAMCACALVAPASAQPTPSTPFMIYGYVYYENGTACNGPVVSITNTNTSEVFTAKTNESYNYYPVLTSSDNVSTGNILNFNASNGNVKEFNHNVTDAEINSGGVFVQNITISGIANHVVISEVCINASDGNGSEWVELYNPTDSAIDMTNWYWCYFSSSSDWNTSSTKRAFPSGTIDGYDFYLILVNGTVGVTFDWNLGYGTNQLSDTAGSIGIFPFDPDVGKTADEAKNGRIDAVGWGSAVGYVYETVNASVPSSGKSLQRKINATITEDGYGPAWDTNNNSGDFFIQTTPNPQNLGTGPVPPIPELPTIILFSTGLLALAGYVWLTKRRR